MSEESVDDNRQFEQVLSRLDALMKRSQEPVVQPPMPLSPVDDMPFQIVSGGDEPVDNYSEIPVLTEVYLGASLVPVQVDAVDVPVLTEALPERPDAQEGLVPAETAVQQDESGLPEETLEAQVEAGLLVLMPSMRAMVASVVQEEMTRIQQALEDRLVGEAEQLLRQHLMAMVKPK